MSWPQPYPPSPPAPASPGLRVLVCGDRAWGNYTRMYMLLDLIHHTIGISCVIQGEARGADRMGKTWAMRENVPWQAYPALWHQHHKGAGPIRNQQMLDEGKPDFVLGFHDSIESSRGTYDMLRRASNAGLPTFLVSSHTCELLEALV